MALMRIGASADFVALFTRPPYAAASLPLKADHPKIGKLHVGVVRQYPEAPRIPLPSNVSEISNIETSRFVPDRIRDITGSMLLLNTKIVSKQSTSAFANSVKIRQLNSHVELYCFGTISLSGVMQTNVPKPFCSSGKSTFLNMPGGQWTREGKYLADDMRKSHFNIYKMQHVKRYGGSDGIFSLLTIRGYVTAAENAGSNKSSSSRTANLKSINQSEWMKMSKSQRLQVIIKDYGRTVIVFHVGISLISLGIFYTLVSSGLDLTEVIKLFTGDATDESGTNQSDELVNKIMSGGSTFLIAYAIHKLFAPIRLSMTLILTPIIVKFLRAKGIYRVPKITTAAAAVATKTK